MSLILLFNNERTHTLERSPNYLKLNIKNKRIVIDFYRFIKFRHFNYLAVFNFIYNLHNNNFNIYSWHDEWQKRSLYENVWHSWNCFSFTFLWREDCDFTSKISEWTEIATFLYFSFALGTTLQEDFTMKLYMFT